MEKACILCGYNQEDKLNKSDITVLLICEDCLKSHMLTPFLEKILPE
jgi:hypothetical protein